MSFVYLSIGSNIGDRIGYIKKALVALSKLPKTKITKISSLYETEPYGRKEQPWFVNIVVEMFTELSPVEHQPFDARLKINNQIRSRYIFLKQTNEHLVEFKFITFQINMSKDFIFVKDIICYQILMK